MTIAMVVNKNRLANHFVKAPELAFFNADNTLIKVTDNPAKASSCCSGKKATVALLQESNVKKVIVRNIGQRMLGRLLKADIQVFQSPFGGEADAILNRLESCKELTEAEQGKLPAKHASGHSCEGGCGGHAEGSEHGGKEGCGSHSEGSEHDHAGKGGCGKDKSKGKCCHS
jgi:predicted Fe-Mo cluster-binding NifX family protein